MLWRNLGWRKKVEGIDKVQRIYGIRALNNNLSYLIKFIRVSFVHVRVHQQCQELICSYHFLMGNRNPQKRASRMLSKAIVGGGCFWCVEAVLQRLKGVHKIQSGYAGGQLKNPSYEAICSGQTGHAEVCRIYFDPKIIEYSTLLYIFMHVHDPTTLNRQGNDSGTQYRSIIFYEKGNEQEQKTIRQVLQQVAKQGKYPGYPAKIVTEVKELDEFYVAEEYHQNYYNLNPNQGYCRAVIKPKMSKFKALFEKYIDLSRL